MRSYKHPTAAEGLLNECTVWQACRATSAATTFFDPITIGKKGQRFIDGGLRCNNPVYKLQQEAATIWPDQDSLLISIGTGEAPGTSFSGNILDIVKGLRAIVFETEDTANDFFNHHKDMVDDKRYYRFNVTHGLASIGLEEWNQISAIADATETYLDRGEAREKCEQCVNRMLQIDSEGTERVISHPD